MKKLFWTGLAVFLFISSQVLAAPEQVVKFGRFGKITLYRQSPHPKHIVLFISGDGGWKLGVLDMAKALTKLDALVVGVDITKYYGALKKSKDECYYCAADFEELSKFIQKKLGYSTYTQPVLVGYSSGATLAYALMVQAPSGTFKGAISLGFCPDLEWNKPLCKGYGLHWTKSRDQKEYIYSPVSKIEFPWVVFQGQIDQVCNAKETEAYVHKIENARLVRLPKVGHGFSVQRNWMPQFKKAFEGMTRSSGKTTSQTDSPLSDLPLVEIPSLSHSDKRLAIMISGDGGWAGLDREVASGLVRQGVSVVGVNALKYFWTPRTPDSAGKDLERIVSHYISSWGKSKIVLIGYSLGADVLPFMANRLSAPFRDKVVGLVLISPSQTTSFEFHIGDWVGNSDKSDQFPVLPEIDKWGKHPLLCLAGSDEKDSLCNDFSPIKAKIHIIPGGHHLGGNYQKIVDLILKETP